MLMDTLLIKISIFHSFIFRSSFDNKHLFDRQRTLPFLIMKSQQLPAIMLFAFVSTFAVVQALPAPKDFQEVDLAR